MASEIAGYSIAAKVFLTLGAAFGLIGVLAGAAGAHATSAQASGGAAALFQTGVQYEFYHALALLVVGGLLMVMPQRALLVWAGGLFIAGIVLFSGSLYLIVLSGRTWLALLTPVGGTAFIMGWIVLLLAVLRTP